MNSGLTQAQTDALQLAFYAGEKFPWMVAGFIALAVDHALKTPDFAEKYGTFAVECIEQAAKS